MSIRSKNIRIRLKQLDKFLLKEYKELHPKRERDDALYEKEIIKRIKKVMKNLSPLVDEATNGLRVYRARGNKPSIKPNEKVKIILIKQLIDKSNRNMAYMLSIFSMMSGIDVSYKTIERLYSDEEVELALHNLFIILLNKRGVKNIDCCGDATGYSLIISKHYSSEISKRKDEVKDQSDKKARKIFAYQFALMDLKSKMYVCYGMSLISEAKAFAKAMQMLEETGININSIRLDRYYSFPCYVNMFKESKVYILPRKNAQFGNGLKWFETMKNFLEDTMAYLEQYYMRENSESGFAQDKKFLGWKIMQKIEERIDTALFCKSVWHNLLWLYAG